MLSAKEQAFSVKESYYGTMISLPEIARCNEDNQLQLQLQNAED